MDEVNLKCQICSKLVTNYSRSMFCNSCKTWSHQKCNKFSNSDFCDLINSRDYDFWYCSKCNDAIFPFSQINCDSSIPLPNANVNNIKSLISQLNSLNSNFDFQSFDTATVNCKYYDCDEFSNIPNKSKCFSALHLNISSLSRHFDELCIMLNLLRYNFGIIGITETRIIKNITPTVNFSLPGYSIEHTTTESSCGGALLFISDKLLYRPRKDLTQLLYKTKNLESIFIEVTQPKKTNIIIGTVYKHPMMSIDEFNIEYLNPLLEKTSSENKTIILLGDFNINLLLNNSVSNVSNFMDILGSYSMLPSILLPTRITTVTSTLIDNIFSNSQHINKAGNIIFKISDHLPQFILINSTKSPSCQTPVFKRKWSSFKKEDFVLDYLNIDWNKILKPLEEVDLSFSTFFNKMNNLVDQHVPIVKLSKKQIKTLYKPWITPGIITSIHKRNHLFKLYIKCKVASEKSILHIQYKKYRNSIVSLCKISKSNYFKTYFQNNLGNIKKIWQGVNNIINFRSLHNPPISLSINGLITSNSDTISNTFNKYFCSIADSIRLTIPPCNAHFTNYLKNSLSNSFFIAPTNPSEIISIISSLSDNVASGPYSLPNFILKLLKHDISKPLSHIINLSFSSGCFPSLLKISKVIPVFKKGSPQDVSNYRPISLLSNIEKIIEKLMYSRIIKFLNCNNVLFSRQFGFRQGHSTSHALICITERILKALDNGHIACGVFIDLKKAFDTVDHNILLFKLSHYGIRGITNQWFKSYLSDRQQFVSISDLKSELCKISCGVPQGSVLGPLLFLIYVNDLQNALIFSEPYLFADDTNLLHISNSIDSLNKKLNIDLKLLCKWLNANKIALNTDKTQLIIFKSKLKSFNFNLKLKINGKKLYPCSHIKYLGVILDEYLNWHKHIDSLSVKLRRANGALSILRHYVPKSILLSIYHAIFSSHLIYGCQVWAQHENMYNKRILLLQKSAIRIICFAPPRSHSKPLFYELKVLTIFDIVKMLNVIFVHQVLNLKAPPHIISTFNFSHISHNFITRSKVIGLLKKCKINTDSFGKYSLTFQCTTNWNFFQKYFYCQDLSTVNIHKLKSIISKYYLDSYLV